MADAAVFGPVPVTFEVVCRTGPRGPGVRHPVTVHPDGSVDTGHDLALERLAAAMGGYLSCLELVDRFVPSVRDLWLFRRRLAAPGIVHVGGTWRVAAPVSGCRCDRATWKRPHEPAAHLREPAHWALRHGADRRQFARRLADLEGEVTGLTAPPRWEGRLAEEVIDSEGLAWLWDLGVGPHLVHHIHAELGLGEPLRAATYAEVATGGVDLAWLTRFVPHGADTVAWAAATHCAADGKRPGEREAWVAAGVNRRLLLALLGGPYSVADAQTLAARGGLTVNEAGRLLVGWLAAGCEPTIADLVRLCRLDLGRYAPSAGALAALRERAPTGARAMTATELGLVLVAAGTLTAAARGLRDRENGAASGRSAA